MEPQKVITNDNEPKKQPAEKTEAVIAHEKVLRLECLKLATGTRIVDDSASDIVKDAQEFSAYVIGA